MQSGRHSLHGTSSRPKDVPRDILRQQDRLRAEQQFGIVKKQRKLKQSETYHAAPPGYVFMPLGTPELADLCKELSRQEGFPIHVVNAKPTSKVVLDPTKISHHVQRIGYHFKDSVVEEACSQLHYMIADGKFVSESDLRQTSVLAKIMARHGLQVTKRNKHEPPERLKAAIRELFPAIPDQDLDEVVKHAWEENSSRVGTIEGIDLSRRIQLAVLARIRHKYTDYDTLLKVFDWTQCRKEVESSCLKKLLEWRGETGDGTDDGLEEIVAETMLLEEQSDAPRSVRAAKVDRRRHSGYDTGDASDASIEFFHQVAAPEDLRAESPADHAHGYFAAQRPPIHTLAERHDIARAKLQAVRAQMQYPVPQHVYNHHDTNEQIEHVHVPTDGHGQAPTQIVVNGRLLQRASPEPVVYPQRHETYNPPPYRPVHGTPALVQQVGHPQLMPVYNQQQPSHFVQQPHPQPYPQAPSPYPYSQTQPQSQPQTQSHPAPVQSYYHYG